MTENKVKSTNFIKNIIDHELATGECKKVVTRFPPEPNGYLHIGHAKSICINFGLANDYKGYCHLRFDDTNPEKEDIEYVNSIKEMVKWLGFDWRDKLFFASSYFQKLHDFAVELIKQNKAYVCDLNADEMRQYRGTLTEAGRESPSRNRSVEDNISLFKKMKDGEFDEGQHVLRAKIDMNSGNINLRDPILYRIKKVVHPISGEKWNIYPMYDFAHTMSDFLEGITHSLCSLEFQDHRPLYDWFLDSLTTGPRPKQIEFSRLNINYTVMSKRLLKKLVEERHVIGWDDPRMPTLAGLRRRGFSPESIKAFCERIGVSKSESITDYGELEDCLRNDLNQSAQRVMGVLDPIKVTIEDYPDGKAEELVVANHPQNPAMGTRKITFSKNLFIERDDVMENPPKGYFRLSPGVEVRLRYGYIIKCNQIIKNDADEITEIRCTHDANTLGKNPEGRKVKGIIHWISEDQSLKAEVRLYDRLFTSENPGGVETYLNHLNNDSLHINCNARVEKSLASAKAGSQFQFERLGYFCLDSVDSKPDALVFNRSVTLRDTWKKT